MKVKVFDLSQIKGSGPNGRIVKADLEAIKEAVSNSVQANEAKAPASAAIAIESIPTLEALDIPVSNMRKSIAGALVASKTQAPHFIYKLKSMALHSLT